MKEKHSHEEIARLAYQLWERRGRPLGSPEMDWDAAENVLSARDSKEEFSLPGVRFEPDEGGYREP